AGTTSSSSPSTTTATAPSTTAPAGSPTTTAPPALPSYHHRLAWVGIVWGTTTTCPGTGTNTTGSTTTAPLSSAATVYVAVVIDARTGRQVLAYQSGGASPCTGASEAPAVTRPDELLSVPWTIVGSASTAVQIQVPPCGHYYGWTQIPTTGGGVADQVVVAVPFDPACGDPTSHSQAVDQVVPLGAGQGLATHAPVGPVDALRALPVD
ncbi:MAG: hypothetical protein ACRDY1_13360, partial [Acidimicrobiales bacterium]